MNTANRAFLALVAIALVPYVLFGLIGCGVLILAAYRVAVDGIDGLQRPGEDVRLAVVFSAIVAAGTVLAVASWRRQVVATRRLARFVADHRAPVPAEVGAQVRRSGLWGRLDVLEDARPFSFTYGVLSPRVAVSRGLVEGATSGQLDAVLAHERYHIRSFDTIKVVVARAATAAFFFLPVLGWLRWRYLAGRELAADRHAVRAHGQGALAGALFRVVDSPAWTDVGAAAALGGGEFLEQRIEQLETGDEPEGDRVPRRVLWATGVGLAAITIVFVAAVATGSTSALRDERTEMRDWALFDGWTGTVAMGVGMMLCVGWWVLVALVAARAWRRSRVEPVDDTMAP